MVFHPTFHACDTLAGRINVLFVLQFTNNIIFGQVKAPAFKRPPCWMNIPGLLKHKRQQIIKYEDQLLSLCTTVSEKRLLSCHLWEVPHSRFPFLAEWMRVFSSHVRTAYGQPVNLKRLKSNCGVIESDSASDRVTAVQPVGRMSG